MALAITIKGIDEALSHFNHKNKTALKYRLISVVREYGNGNRKMTHRGNPNLTHPLVKKTIPILPVYSRKAS
ncbi:MAG: hypothetical protein P9M03_00565 [Candidatus Theseobacter exili]|nr:hypothetical protein [Candidatus Theseobacter exili]